MQIEEQKEAYNKIKIEKMNWHNAMKESTNELEENKEMYQEKKEKLMAWKNKFSEETTILREKLSMMEGERHVLEKRLAEKDKQCKEDYEKNTGLEHEVVRIRSELDHLTTEILETKEQGHKKDTILLENRCNIKTLTKEVHELKAINKDLSEKNDGMYNNLQTSLNAYKEKKRAKVNKINSLIDEKESTIESLQTEFSELRNKYNLLKLENDDLQKTNSELTLTKEKLQSEAEISTVTCVQYSFLKTEYDNCVTELTKKKKVADEKESLLQDHIKKEIEFFHQHELKQIETERLSKNEHDLKENLEKTTLLLNSQKEECINLKNLNS